MIWNYLTVWNIVIKEIKAKWVEEEIKKAIYGRQQHTRWSQKLVQTFWLVTPGPNNNYCLYVKLLLTFFNHTTHINTRLSISFLCVVCSFQRGPVATLHPHVPILVAQLHLLCPTYIFLFTLKYIINSSFDCTSIYKYTSIKFFWKQIKYLFSFFIK